MDSDSFDSQTFMFVEEFTTFNQTAAKWVMQWNHSYPLPGNPTGGAARVCRRVSPKPLIDTNSAFVESAFVVHIPLRYLSVRLNSKVRVALLGLTSPDFGYDHQQTFLAPASRGCREEADDYVYRDAHVLPSGGLVLVNYNPVTFDAIAFAQPVRCQLTGQILSPDILVTIFLWLPPDQTTMLSIGAVSTGWRQCSENLPQWCIVPELLHPHHAALQFVEPATDCEQFYGVFAHNRTSFMDTMCIRRAAKTRAEKLMLGSPFTRFLLEWRIYLLIQWLLVCGVVVLIFATAYGIGRAAVINGTFNSDGKVGAMCFFMNAFVLLLVPLVLYYARFLVRPNTAHERNLRKRAHFPFLIAAAITTIMLSTVVGLLSARLTMAQYMADRTWTYSNTSCPLMAAAGSGSEAPRYVVLQSIGQWTVSPTLTASASSCTAPNNSATLAYFGSRWWGDQYINSRYDASTVTSSIGYGFVPAADLSPWDSSSPCTDTYTAGAVMGRFVVLRPPSKWTNCSVSVALVYDALSADFNTTITNYFSNRAVTTAATDTAVFRTPVSSPFLPIGYTDMGDSWFSSASSSPWRTSGVTLAVAPGLGAQPWDIVSSWQTTLVTWFIPAVCFMVAALVVTCPPRYITRARTLFNLCACLAFTFVNPLWLLGWGAKCTFAFSASVCMMSHTSALALFSVGLLLSAVMTVAAGTYLVGMLNRNSDG